MEFCSKYGYDYGFNGSDEESIEDDDSVTNQRVQKKVRKIDSNIIACKFDRLVLSQNMFAGDFVSCKKCTGILTGLSKKNIQSDEKSWTCDFCYEKNDLKNLIKTLDELPNEDDVTFLLESSNQNEDANPITESSSTNSNEDNSYLSFCIDVSGSMDEKIQLKKNNDNKEEQVVYEPSYMSRLEGVKLACIETLKSLKDDSPNKKVSIVTFSDDVKFFGDCSKDEPLVDTTRRIHDFSNFGNVQQQQFYVSSPVQQQQIPTNTGFIGRLRSGFGKSRGSNTTTQAPVASQPEISEDVLFNREKMISLAKNQDGNLKPIQQSYPNLEHKIKLLRTEGSTALGPALAFSIGFSTKKNGSQVCVCTDGCANVGMGTIEYGNIKEAERFYSQIAEYAKNNGVSVNVISMEGTDCKLSLLGKLADQTNGTMKIVNPLNLSEEFKSILENRIVATNVKAKLIVNSKFLYIRDEELESLEAKAIDANDLKTKEELNTRKKSVYEKEIGNALIETEITFEYGIRKLADNSSKANDFKELPFQLQITYTDMNGNKAIRVYTKVQEFTKDRQVAESNIVSADLMFSNAGQKISHLTIDNSVVSAQYRSKAMDKFVYVNKLNAPIEYSSKAVLVQRLRKSMKYEEMDDFASEEMYSGKKMNRKFKK